MNRRTLAIAALAAAATAPILAAPAVAQLRSTGTLLDVLKNAQDLQRFLAIVTQAGLEGEFSKPGSFGMFVPHDHSLLDVPPARLANALRDAESRRRFVLNHLSAFNGWVLPGGARSEGGGEDVQEFRSFAGQWMRLVQGSGSLPVINGQRIYVANVRVSNGVGFCIDGFLWV